MSTASENNSTTSRHHPDTSADASAIYDHFWRRLRPIALGTDCDGQPVRTGCRNVPEEWEAIVAYLLDTFGEECLESSGIANRDEDGRWTLAPALEPGGVLVALRRSPDEPVFEILTPSGGLVGEEPAITAALQDHRSINAIPRADHLLLACVSTDQIPPFSAQFLPATTLSGLLDLNHQELREVWRQLGRGILGPGQHTEPAAYPVSLVLADWDVRGMRAGQSSEVRRVARFLANAERCLHIDMSNCGVWVPDKDELDRYRFCRNVRDLNASREALLQSIDNSTYAISAFAAPGFVPRRKPGNVIEAYADLEQCIEVDENRPVTTKRRQEAWEVYEGFVEADLIQPLQQQALESCDPMTRTLGMVTADASRLLHLQAPYLERDLLKLVKGLLSPEDQQRVLKQVSQHDRAVANLIRLVELQRR